MIDHRLFVGLPMDLVELGPGTGTRLRCDRPGTRLTASERAVGRPGVTLDVREAGAESTGVDAVLRPVQVAGVVGA